MENEYLSKETGLRLLKKGRQGLWHAIFSRFGIIVLMLFAQVLVLLWMFSQLGRHLPEVYSALSVISVLMVFYLVNTTANPSVKVSWLLLIMTFPVFGSLFYAYTQADVGHRALKNRMNQMTAESSRLIPENVSLLKTLREQSVEVANLTHYISSSGFFQAFERTAVEYFPLGEDKFKALLEELEKAKHFIFMEYFIIAEGEMWGQVLEVLVNKAKEGVEVRLMYDGTNEFFNVSHDYPIRLRALGIQCKMFSPVRPFVSTHYNYRDHRKIVVIDGHTAFTGGINLADEYINVKERFGHWKDTAIMLKGDAVKSFTMMFLQMWYVTEKQVDFETYLAYPTNPPEHTEGFVIPYGDVPLDAHKVGKMVYIDILNHAERYVHIMTPYLILDGEMETALIFAAERGVDVEIILPGIPDKKTAFALAKTHYKKLLRAGVKLYEYTPGFVHAKGFVSDDKKAVVGTINLDYRSLYHHFECAAYLYDMPVVADVEEDFKETKMQCSQVTEQTIRREKLWLKALGAVLKVIAPLM